MRGGRVRINPAPAIWFRERTTKEKAPARQAPASRMGVGLPLRALLARRKGRPAVQNRSWPFCISLGADAAMAGEGKLYRTIVTSRIRAGLQFFPFIKQFPLQDRTPRASRFWTVDTCQRPPRAVRMPRAFSASAMLAKLHAPELRIASTIGMMFAAKRSASSI